MNPDGPDSIPQLLPPPALIPAVSHEVFGETKAVVIVVIVDLLTVVAGVVVVIVATVVVVIVAT